MKKNHVLIAVFFCLMSVPALAGHLITLNSGTSSDLLAADYHPDDSYALVVGDGVYTYDRSGLVQISTMGPFNDVEWRPQGDYALMVGDYGILYKYDGSNLTMLNSGVMAPLTRLAFSPSGDLAVIVGYDGVIISYDGATGAIKNFSIGGSHFLEGVSWNPNGLTALIVGIYNFSDEEVIRFDRNSAKIEWSGPSAWPGDIDFHPTSGYALIVEDWGHAAIYDSNYYNQITTGFEQKTDGLNSVSWSPNGATALITGAWFHSPLPAIKTLVEYDGKTFNTLRMFEQGDNYFEDVAWKHDSKEALVVGHRGELGNYFATPSVAGKIYCDSGFYKSGEKISAFLDMQNNGAALSVDGYISLVANFNNTLYWPGFGSTPVPISRILPSGINVQGVNFFNGTVPQVPWQTYINWELWVFDSGSMDYDDLYSYSVFTTVIDP